MSKCVSNMRDALHNLRLAPHAVLTLLACAKLCCAFAACCRARSALTAPCAFFAVACNAATRCCSGVLSLVDSISFISIEYLAASLRKLCRYTEQAWMHAKTQGGSTKDTGPQNCIAAISMFLNLVGSSGLAMMAVAS